MAEGCGELSGYKGQKSCWHRKGHSESGKRGGAGVMNGIWELGATSRQGKELVGAKLVGVINRIRHS